MLRKLVLKKGDSIVDLKSSLDNWDLSVLDYYQYLFGKEAKINFLKEELESNILTSDILVFREREKLSAFMSLEHMSWESNIFNCKVGKINFINHSNDISDEVMSSIILGLIDYSKSCNYNMLYVKVHTKDIKVIRAFNKHNFLLTDTSLDFVADLNTELPSRINKGIEIREADPSLKQSCIDLMEQSFGSHYGRFANDPNLNSRSNEVYKSWIEASLNGYADVVLVALENEKLAGVSIWKYQNATEKKSEISMGHYSIGAIHPDFSGRKIFHDLTAEGMSVLKNKKFKFIEGPTNIANYPVQNAYARLGWRNLSSKHCFHYWID